MKTFLLLYSVCAPKHTLNLCSCRVSGLRWTSFLLYSHSSDCWCRCLITFLSYVLNAFMIWWFLTYCVMFLLSLDLFLFPVKSCLDDHLIYQIGKKKKKKMKTWKSFLFKSWALIRTRVQVEFVLDSILRCHDFDHLEIFLMGLIDSFVTFVLGQVQDRHEKSIPLLEGLSLPLLTLLITNRIYDDPYSTIRNHFNSVIKFLWLESHKHCRRNLWMSYPYNDHCAHPKVSPNVHASIKRPQCMSILNEFWINK